MNLTRFLYFIATIVEVAKSSADADDVSLLAQRLFDSTHLLQGSSSNDEKESKEKDEEASSVNKRPKRMLEAGNKRLLQLISINIGCCEEEYEEIFTTSDGDCGHFFGASCSMSGDLVVIGAPGVDIGWYDLNKGAAYLFNLNGTEVAKLTPGDNEEDYDYSYDYFGASVAIDEKIVVGTSYFTGGYFRVFSRQGIYERTLTCNECGSFRPSVATLGNLIVTNGKQNSIWKLFIFTTEGQLLKSFEQDGITAVAISEQFIVSTFRQYNNGGKTIIYSNTSPEFPKIAEINQWGYEVAVAGDRIVIGDSLANDYDGVAYLYKTDGTLVTALDRQCTSSESRFGWSVAITDDKVLVGARYDDDQGCRSGSVFIYSAVTGEFVEKVLAPDGEANDRFGSSVCASDSYFVVGAPGDDDNGYSSGAAYLFQFSED